MKIIKQQQQQQQLYERIILVVLLVLQLLLFSSISSSSSITIPCVVSQSITETTNTTTTTTTALGIWDTNDYPNPNTNPNLCQSTIINSTTINSTSTNSSTNTGSNTNSYFCDPDNIIQSENDKNIIENLLLQMSSSHTNLLSIEIPNHIKVCYDTNGNDVTYNINNWYTDTNTTTNNDDDTIFYNTVSYDTYTNKNEEWCNIDSTTGTDTTTTTATTTNTNNINNDNINNRLITKRMVNVQIGITLMNKMKLQSNNNMLEKELFVQNLHTKLGIGYQCIACSNSTTGSTNDTSTNDTSTSRNNNNTTASSNTTITEGTGILIFISKNDRYVYISKGKLIDTIVSNKRLDTIITTMKYYLRQEQYTESILYAIQQIQYYINNNGIDTDTSNDVDIDIDIDTNYFDNDSNIENDTVSTCTTQDNIHFIVIVCCILTFIIIVKKQDRMKQQQHREYTKLMTQLNNIDTSHAIALQGKFNCTSCPICLESFIIVPTIPTIQVPTNVSSITSSNITTNTNDKSNTNTTRTKDDNSNIITTSTNDDDNNDENENSANNNNNNNSIETRTNIELETTLQYITTTSTMTNSNSNNNQDTKSSTKKSNKEEEVVGDNGDNNNNCNNISMSTLVSSNSNNNNKMIGSDGFELKLLRCGHVFDISCWEEWISTGRSKINKCPICQQNVTTNNSSTSSCTPCTSTSTVTTTRRRSFSDENVSRTSPISSPIGNTSTYNRRQATSTSWFNTNSRDSMAYQSMVDPTTTTSTSTSIESETVAGFDTAAAIRNNDNSNNALQQHIQERNFRLQRLIIRYPQYIQQQQVQQWTQVNYDQSLANDLSTTIQLRDSNSIQSTTNNYNNNINDSRRGYTTSTYNGSNTSTGSFGGGSSCGGRGSTW